MKSRLYYSVTKCGTAVEVVKEIHGRLHKSEFVNVSKSSLCRVKYLSTQAELIWRKRPYLAFGKV